MDIIVKDDVFGSQIQDLIFTKLTENNSPWIFTEDMTSSNQEDKNMCRFGFSKLIYEASREIRRPEFDIIYPLFINVCNQNNIMVEEIINLRGFLSTPLGGSQPQQDHPHVDLEVPHLVCLYYVNDSDGDTVFYDKMYDKNVDLSDIKEYRRVTPKQGRMVFFNGLRYHTASRPTKNYRIVLNSDIRGVAL